MPGPGPSVPGSRRVRVPRGPSGPAPRSPVLAASAPPADPQARPRPGLSPVPAESAPPAAPQAWPRRRPTLAHKALPSPARSPGPLLTASSGGGPGRGREAAEDGRTDSQEGRGANRGESCGRTRARRPLTSKPAKAQPRPTRILSGGTSGGSLGTWRSGSSMAGRLGGPAPRPPQAPGSSAGARLAAPGGSGDVGASSGPGGAGDWARKDPRTRLSSEPPVQTADRLRNSSPSRFTAF